MFVLRLSCNAYKSCFFRPDFLGRLFTQSNGDELCVRCCPAVPVSTAWIMYSWSWESLHPWIFEMCYHPVGIFVVTTVQISRPLALNLSWHNFDDFLLSSLLQIHRVSVMVSSFGKLVTMFLVIFFWIFVLKLWIYLVFTRIFLRSQVGWTGQWKCGPSIKPS
jgi:hypothetical protein